MRPEHIALHDVSGGAQFYIACAQIRVTNGGNGSPGPLVSIPGVYSGNVSIYIYCSFLLGIVESETNYRERGNLFEEIHVFFSPKIPR
jgi:hypothetical protein